MEIVLGFFVLVFVFGYLFDFDGQARKEASQNKMSFEDVCKNSMALSVAQYTLDHVKICGVENVIRLNSEVTKVANEICQKYGFKIVNAEGARVFHLSKI